MKYWQTGLAILLAGMAQQVFSAEYTDRLIIKFRAHAVGVRSVMSAPQEAALSQTAGVQLLSVRAMSGGGQVMRLPQSMPITEAQAVADKVQSNPDVEYAEPDRIRYPMLAANDPYYLNGSQWNLNGAYGIQAPSAWDITTGSSSVVVAVLDSGITSHADLSGRVMQGHDFITDTFVANDGDGRDTDPADPGDWVTQPEIDSHPIECTGAVPRNSYWHGTAMAGLIGAFSNNADGIAGVNWVSKILPVRVMGKCGGSLIDIADGLRWAAGLSVPGAPVNPYPAKVLNLSLGGAGACSQTEQDAINDVIAAGKVVIVAAGNENGSVANSSPANCTGVIAVTATNSAGARWESSLSVGANTGNQVTVSAPGQSIVALWDSGTMWPVAGNYVSLTGTSASAALVSGVVSLMLSVNSQLSPAQVNNILQSTATAFPDSTCTTSTCGAGIVNAAAAVSLASTTTGAPVVSSSSGGGGGGGGCAFSSAIPFDPILACVAGAALAGLFWRRTRRQ